MSALSREEIERLCLFNLIANPGERFFFKDRESRFVLVSEGWLAALAQGRPLAEVIGKTDFDFAADRDQAQVAFEDEQRVIATGQPMVTRIDRDWLPGRPDTWLQVVKFPLRDRDGNIVGTWGMTRDVTAQVEAEQALAVARDEAVAASNMKSAFLANVSHEIRTPMVGVLGTAELLLDGDLDEDQRQLVTQVLRSGEVMVDLINDILDFAKIEAGRLVLEVTDFPLRETIEQACSSAGVTLQAKGVAFELEIADEVPQQARGDGLRLRQILLNLVSNAVKFTSEGNVTVRASMAPRSGADALLRVEVSDTGIGIEASIMNQMFEPFTQADAATTRHYGGSGLGLAISRELTELLGGTIGADSEPGVGSTFWLELPLTTPEATHSDAKKPSQPGVAEQPSWSMPPLVLVAEDNVVNQIVAARTLERLGCHADVVADGREALEALAARHYDAVLMDCQMPVMDGYEATTDLRRRESSEQHTPVIAMTANAMDGAVEKCLAAGMDDYIAKPMRRAQLIDILRAWIPPQEVGGNGR